MGRQNTRRDISDLYHAELSGGSRQRAPSELRVEAFAPPAAEQGCDEVLPGLVGLLESVGPVRKKGVGERAWGQ